MRQFYLAFPIRDALRTELSWTHYRRSSRIPDSDARIWYMNECADSHWRTRQLERAQKKPIVKEDRLGFGTFYYQAKRWDPNRTVGRPDVQAFVGALSGKGTSKGLFITTASFSQEAGSYAESLRAQKVVLIDGNQLAKLMIEYNVGVSTRTAYEVKALDSDFFEDE